MSDIARIEIHTNFTGTAKKVHTLALADLDKPESISLLRRAFTDPESFKPTVTAAKITEDAAEGFAKLATALQSRGHDPHDAAHFLMKCMFCLFAEDVGLFGTDPETNRPLELFRRLLARSKQRPEQLTSRLSELFNAMRKGGDFGGDPIPWFNGGLFNESPALPLTEAEVGVLMLAAAQDWSSVEPAIFGTLFERSLDPTKRAQIGAHYTSREDILLIVEPVVMAPLRREWADVREKVEALIERRRKPGDVKDARKAKRDADAAIAKAIEGFLARLAGVRILDPACGSGNFLYVAIQQLLNLEKEVINYAARPDIGLGLFPRVRPTQLHGIEINPYAAELAQVVIWIGYLQWMRDNGFNAPRDPILENLSTIENRDAILDLSHPQHPAPAKWPAADFIIGNPPFLGSKVFRQNGVADDYIAAMAAAYDLPRTSDLCCYWFELGRRTIEAKPATRAGLLATQGIRGGDNRTVLERIKSKGDIFMAWADRAWILDGAAVRVSMIGFAKGVTDQRMLNGSPVQSINADLTTGDDLTSLHSLDEMDAISFQGLVKVGDFNLDHAAARAFLGAPKGPTGKANHEVVKPWFNGNGLAKRYQGEWIIDFGLRELVDAAAYEAPFEYVQKTIKPIRESNKDKQRRIYWWRLGRTGEDMRAKTSAISRFISTPRVAKHRFFVWLDSNVIPDARLVGIGSASDYVFGVVHSAIHEVWSLKTCAWHGVGNDPTYNNGVTFNTFAMPWSPRKEPTDHPVCKRIATAAKALNEQRERWLNPPEWIDSIAKAVDLADKFKDVPAEARPLIRQSAIMAAAAKDARLKKRTLTNLYNERPTWLKLAHLELDKAVLAAYAATDKAPGNGGWTEAWAEVWQDTGAGQPLPDGHGLAGKRAEIEKQVLANLLRLNKARAGK